MIFYCTFQCNKPFKTKLITEEFLMEQEKMPDATANSKTKTNSK